MDSRIGFGWDFHRLIEGRKLFLGGVEIPFEKGLLGHSDADVLLHALGDALLGAVGERDLGYHFPDTDPENRDISSRKIIGKIREIVIRKGYRIVNLDTTIVAQKPRLSDHIPAIVATLSEILGIPAEAVGVKAKTAEGVGEIGEGRGISAYAIVLLAPSNS